MFDRITYISDHSANIKLKEDADVVINLMNLHLVFEDDTKKVLGEVDDMDGNVVKARFLGEIVNGKLVGGTIRKPSLDAKIRVIDPAEIPLITGKDEQGYMKLGVSPFYNDFPVFLDVNNFFSNHFAIFGNSGSGKSCGISRLFQNMFQDQRLYPYKSNIMLFDSSGEYYNAFYKLSSINPNYNYRFYTTNETENKGEKLRLPIYLLNATDLALLLQATNHSQLPIIERMLKLALIFSQEDMDANNYKNHLIAKAIMTILYTNETSPNKRNEIFSIIASCSTPQFSLESEVKGIGYTRKFRELFLINSDGQFSESVLLTEYVSSFIKAEYDNYEPHGGVYYTLDTLEKALNFTLISEGWLRNENTYGDAVTIKVRLHSLIVGNNSKFFDVPDYISLESYLSSMLIDNGRKYQIVNINLDDVDDDFAKVITKIYSRLIFEFAKGLKNRASIPFHIIVEEAHRYIQNDTDRFLIGYNIFERIAKEGRKYGVILGLISQRPVELSDTVISQCSNFLIFKMNHPVDVEYIRKMVPNISDEIVEKQKTLQSGTCLGFGMAFRIPLIIKMEMPNPAPWSGNCDVVTIWNGNGTGVSNVSTVDNISEINDNSVEQTVTAIPENVMQVNVAIPEFNAMNNNTQSVVQDVVNDLDVEEDKKPIDMFVIPDIDGILKGNNINNNESNINSVDNSASNVESVVEPIPEIASSNVVQNVDSQNFNINALPDIGTSSVNFGVEGVSKPLIEIADITKGENPSSINQINQNVAVTTQNVLPATDSGKPLVSMIDVPNSTNNSVVENDQSFNGSFSGINFVNQNNDSSVMNTDMLIIPDDDDTIDDAVDFS